MRPSNYLLSPHLAFRAIWVWDPWSTFRTIDHCWVYLLSTTKITKHFLKLFIYCRSARAFSLMSSVFQKLLDCVSSVNWLKSSACLPIHKLLCEELSHSLAFCAFFWAVERVLKFQGQGTWSFWLRLQNKLVQKIRKKNIVLFVKLACCTNFIYGTGTQISGSGSSHPKLLGLQLHSPGSFTLISKISSSLTSWRFLGVIVFSQMCEVTMSCSTCSLQKFLPNRDNCLFACVRKSYGNQGRVSL